MAKTDLQLSKVDGLYELSGLTEAPQERLGNRVLVQMLSLRRGDRGSVIYTRLRGGMTATNSRVVGTFAISAARILIFMRRFQEDIRPRSINLRRFSVTQDGQLTLVYNLGGVEGSIEQIVEV